MYDYIYILICQQASKVVWDKNFAGSLSRHGFVLKGGQWCHSGEHEALSLSHIWRVAYQKGFSQ